MEARKRGGLIPGAYSPRFIRGFGWYTRRLLRKRFHAVRQAHDGADLLSLQAESERPMLVLANHPSWWDPLICFFVHRLFMPGRTGCAPIDSMQLEKFRFFRRLGLFGIDPEDPEAQDVLVEYVLGHFTQERRSTCWITPQGRFTDVREPVRIRPGAANIAARAAQPQVFSMAIEYGFWQDARPEVFLRLAEVPDAASRTDWMRSMKQAMQQNLDSLRELVVAREPSAFRLLLGAGAAGRQGAVNPLYEFWLRLRGQRSTIEVDSSGRSVS